MRLYDMSLTEVTQLISQILTESEFSDFENAVNASEFKQGSKDELREGVLRELKNIVGPKVDWSKVASCMQKKDETVNEYTERFCQSAEAYSGITDTPEKVLDDKGPLFRIWSDAEYRKALPFLDLTWSNKTLRSNLDTLATWERDSVVKARVKIAAASFQVNTKNQQKRKCPKREGSCKYCADPSHYTKLVRQLAEVLTIKAVSS
ncbi:Multifunctional CCA protein [Labeo rohita]|uniref:Multifunctional CCA protein n=1 Tax=Labeo rohita TaxID=84645 RepID=A0ABQ8LYG5_LABRO|nr:Multifunctional CCA protein [Labeo rohita]